MVIYVVIGVVVWAAVMAAFFVMSKTSRSSDIQKIKARLTGTVKEKKEKDPSKQPKLFEAEQSDKGRVVVKLLKRYNLHDKVEEMLEQAGLKWKMSTLVNLTMGAFIAGYVIPWLFAPDFLRPYLLITAVAAATVPMLHVYRKRKSRLGAFEAVFPDALEFVARSMRAGHAFSVSLEMLHREFQEPLAGEFRRTFEEHNLGLPLETALQKLAQRIPLLDVQFFVSAVLLQKRTGGNLAEILDKLAYVIRERFKLRGRIRAVSAHGKMTGGALTCIPMGVGVLMFFSNPDYVTFFFTDPTGNLMLGVAMALQVLGFLIIKKIVTIEV